MYFRNLFSFFRRFTFLCFFFLVKLSAPYEFFFLRVAHYHDWLSPAAPDGQVGRLGARPCSRPWEGPSALVLAGLLSCCGCPALRAAGLACDCVRAGLPAAGRTATGGFGTGFGVGVGADWAAFPAGGGVALTGITDSSLALLVGGSCVSPLPAMRSISFVATTLVAF